MEKVPVKVSSSYLGTLESLENRELVCGKIENKSIPDAFIFYLIELASPFKTKIVDRILKCLNLHFFSLSEEATLEDFELMLEGINEELSKLVNSGESSWLGNLNSLIGLINDDEVYLSQSGRVGGYIFRKEKISSLVSTGACSSHPLKTFTDVTSGKLVSGDQLILGNINLFNSLSLNQLRTLTKLDEPQKEILELCRILKKSRQKQINAIIIKASESNEALENSPDSSGTIYLDEPNETIKIFWNKKILPLLQLFFDKSLRLGKKVNKQSVVYGRKIQDRWQKKYGPETGKLLRQGKKEIGKLLGETGKKIQPQFEKLTQAKGFKHIKIKAVSYKEKNEKATRFFQNGIEMLANLLRYLSRKEKRKFLVGCLILFVLLFAYNKIRVNNDKRSAAVHQIEVVNSYDKATALFKEGKEDLALGKTNLTDKLFSALEFAQNAKEAPENAEKANKLIKDIRAVLDDRTKTVRFYNVTGFEFINNIADIALSGSDLFGLNADGKIYQADTQNKETKLIGSLDKAAGKPQSATFSKSMKKLLVTTDANKIFAFDPANRSSEELKLAEVSQQWEKSDSLSTYSTNLYLLDGSEGNIWKHTLTESGYSAKSSYLDTRKTSIKNAVDFSIDGNVYVLMPNGTVGRFVKGSPDKDFSLKEIPKPDDKILLPSRIYSDEDTNYIFILDKKAGRILKFDKTGTFVNQYVFDEQNIDDFALNSKLQKLWILSGGKIFEGDL